MASEEYLFDLHKAHQEYNKALDFYDDDLMVLKNRLSEVSIKNTDTEIKMEVEKFQNQFIIQKDVIDRLKHDIQISEDAIAEDVKNNPVASDHRKMSETSDLEGKTETFKKLFSEMKEEFNQFIAKNL